MKSKIITGTKANCEEQLEEICDLAKTIVSLEICPTQTNGMYIVVIYIPKTVQVESAPTQQEYTE